MDDDTPLREVRDFVAHGAETGGVICPACSQRAEVYPRTMTSDMARVLIAMWNKSGQDWVKVPGLTNAPKGGDYAKMRFWGLIENRPEDRREDGSSRTGWWRITDLGRDFVLGRMTIVNHAHIYNNEPLRHDGTSMNIRDALGKKFNYAELMSSVGTEGH